MPIILHEHITPSDCDAFASYALFVFGDNLAGRGTGGQAYIRGKSNAVGLPTKCAPHMQESAFLKDSDLSLICRISVVQFMRLAHGLKQGKFVVWPKDGIGTGRAQLRQRAPSIARWYAEQFEKLVRDSGAEMKFNPQIERAR